MLLVGSDDGAYRVSGAFEPGETTAEKVLDSGRVMRLRQFDSLDGVFAATETGLYRSFDGETWTDLGVPREKVYAVTADPAGDRLYAGTRPAHLYVTDDVGPNGSTGGRYDWTELDGFQDLPSREEWRTPRHEDVAQVRSLGTHPDRPDRVVAGVEVGGVHVSEDRGETWVERSEGVHDDIHRLRMVGPDEFVAATGFGCFRSTDAGRSWTRLDEGYEQGYFREAFVHDGVIYAGGAPASPGTWEERSNHALFESRLDEDLRAVEYPTPDEVPIGFCVVDGDALATTHRGSLLLERSGVWERVGSVPTPGSVSGRYLPLTWVDP